MNRLAVKIKEERFKAGLTEMQLAKKCGLSASYIIQVESGKKIINEKVADNILSSLGTKEEFIKEEKVEQKPKKVKSTPNQKIIVEPNHTWSSALAGVIETYSIYELSTNKVIAKKELPIISKKVEGHKPDKLMFIKVTNNDLEHFRIKKDDIVTILKTKDIKNYSLYMIEYKGKRALRQLAKDGSNIKLLKNANDQNAIKAKSNDVKVIGRVIKNEFAI